MSEGPPQTVTIYPAHRPVFESKSLLRATKSCGLRAVTDRRSQGRRKVTGGADDGDEETNNRRSVGRPLPSKSQGLLRRRRHTCKVVTRRPPTPPCP
uniref:Uncharacterized protein n=1 Tax=Plectus sambesii TaxID=2011161 RepID=A0A914UQP3_9BILA